MFDSLNELLCTDTRPIEEQQFVHISSSAGSGIGANGSFLLHHFISSFIKQGHKVCLVSCTETLSQYKIIEHKLGVNLEQAANQGQFHFISLLNLWSSSAGHCVGSNTCTKVCDEDRNSQFFNDISKLVLEEICLKVSTIKLAENQPFLLIFDSLTALSDLGVKCVDILNIICKVKTAYPQVFSTFLTCCQKFNSDNITAERCSLTRQLSHWSDLLFEVDQLTTGFSKDVHGQLKVYRRMNSSLGDKVDTYHYKVSERDLKLFAVGESPAVL